MHCLVMAIYGWAGEFVVMRRGSRIELSFPESWAMNDSFCLSCFVSCYKPGQCHGSLSAYIGKLLETGGCRNDHFVDPKVSMKLAEWSMMCRHVVLTVSAESYVDLGQSLDRER